MCKVRIIQLSKHDVRLRLATKLFSDAGDGDYISPTLQRCQQDEDEDPRPALDFRACRACPWHNCCVIWYQAVVCQWYYDNAEVLADREDVELYCPNCNGLCPSMVLEEEQEDDSEENMHPSWTSFGDALGRLTLFPAGELIDPPAAGALDAESDGFYDDRSQMQRHGEELCIDKELLAKGISLARACLDSLERDLADDAFLRSFAEEPMMHLLRVRLARKCVREVQGAEREAADSFRGMMKRAGFVLGALNTMPREGQSLTTRDGSYSVSREMLDLGKLDRQAVIDACDGPLEQSAVLTERFISIKGLVEIPKRLRHVTARRDTVTPIRPCRRGASGTAWKRRGRFETRQSNDSKASRGAW
ncbi:hypothetical protein N658DRAFT_555488 [Parathielavia hyrcaniae]|uniref:Uncharacterized protein n=1 Tax=Parathielavia hyrcaniae TaxID=113614 RepID=A0AAN6QEC3_9PEZI|nr:hypothetical protein N658DRAFT_555488 [Parathielavia hyrcaniae]